MSGACTIITFIGLANYSLIGWVGSLVGLHMLGYTLRLVTVYEFNFRSLFML